MPREISGLRIARSFVTPLDPAVPITRELDFQLGPRQGIAIHAVLPTWALSSLAGSPSPTNTTFHNGNQTLHLETGSLETVPDDADEDEDTIDSEVFMRQDLSVGGNDDSTTEFRASLSIAITPSGLITYPRPIFAARNITHRAIVSNVLMDSNAHVIIFYVFVEYSLSELGLILARRT